MNNPLVTPFTRWPLIYHGLLAGLAVCAVALVAYQAVYRSDKLLATRDAELRALQTQFHALRVAKPPVPPPDFGQTLPTSDRADDVVRDIGRFAQANALQLASIGVEPRPVTASEFAKVQFNIAATADYDAAKAMVAELLARYPTLGVQSLSMRPTANDQARLDVRLALVLIARD